MLMERLDIIKSKNRRPCRGFGRQASLVEKIKNNEGQSLVEILVAVTVGFILISGAVTLITVSLKSSAQNKFIQGASFLSQDLIDKATIVSEYKWYCPASCTGNYGIYNLQKAPQHYYISTTTPLSSVIGDETVNLNGIVYTRYFYLENVSRDASNNIEANYTSTDEDPSTQKITVITSWQAPAGNSNVTFVKYLTRNLNLSFTQTDWSGGPTTPTDNTVLTPGRAYYADSGNVDYNSATGSIKIK